MREAVGNHSTNRRVNWSWADSYLFCRQPRLEAAVAQVPLEAPVVVSAESGATSAPRGKARSLEVFDVTRLDEPRRASHAPAARRRAATRTARRTRLPARAPRCSATPGERPPPAAPPPPRRAARGPH